MTYKFGRIPQQPWDNSISPRSRNRMSTTLFP